MAWARWVAAPGSRTPPERRVSGSPWAPARAAAAATAWTSRRVFHCWDADTSDHAPTMRKIDEDGGHRHHRPSVSAAARAVAGSERSRSAASDDVDLLDASTGERARPGEAGEDDVGERHGAGDVDGDDAARGEIAADGDAEVLAGHAAVGEHVTGDLRRRG